MALGRLGIVMISYKTKTLKSAIIYNLLSQSKCKITTSRKYSMMQLQRHTTLEQQIPPYCPSRRKLM